MTRDEMSDEYDKWQKKRAESYRKRVGVLNKWEVALKSHNLGECYSDFRDANMFDL